MKKNVVKIYSIFAVLIYIFSVLFFCTSLYKEYSKGKLRTVEDFNFIVSRINREFEKNNSQTTLVQILRELTGNSDKIAEINIEKNSSYIFAYPKKEIADSKYIKNFSYSFSNMQNIYNLNAKMYLLRPSVIYHYGKISFLMILAVTLVTLLIILYTGYTEAKVVPAAEAGSEKEAEKESQIDQVEEEVQTAEKKEESEQATEPADDDAKSDTDTESDAEVEEESEAEGDDQKETEEESESSEIKFENIVEEELNNSIANEKEFAILVMKVIGIAQTSQEYRMMIEMLEDRMKSQGLIFEGKDNCIIILKHDTSLDENLALAENTINEIENTFTENKPICYLGLSNRNQRIVTPQRLMFEAEAALNHAEETEEKVIAFRANTEQYNNFINQQ